MTELKNTLSGAFYLAAALAYLMFDETRSRRWYGAAFAAFVIALGCKTVTATLPAALLVVFWWRRGRIDWRRDAVPLLPFLAAGVAAGLGTAWLEYTWVGATGEVFDLTLVERALLAGRVAWFYAGKLVWPVDLIFIYPRWTIDQAVWWQYLFPLALAGAIGALWAVRGRSRAPLAAALFFCGTLFPVLGFFNVFPFRYSFVADHFQYLASLGVIVALAAGVALVVRRWRPAVSETVIAAAIAVPLFALTFQQSRQYTDAETLYRVTLAANPTSILAMNNLTAILQEGPPEGWDEAARLAQEAVRIAPGEASAHNNLGVAWQRLGRFEDAVGEHREALRLNPTLATAHYNLGLSLAEVGKLEESVASYEASLAIFPAQPEALHNLSKVLMRLRRGTEAVVRVREAARLAPQSADIQMTLGNVLAANGSFADAIAAYREALRLRPDWGEVQHNLAMVLRRAGRVDEALAAFQEAERLMPGAALVQVNVAALLVSMNRLEDAIPHFERALQAPDVLRPAEVHNDLGIVLARLGRLDAAARHFEAAVRLAPDFAAARANLARVKRGPPRINSP
jgi:tetratricopeptide (TPR) repeat protein